MTHAQPLRLAMAGKGNPRKYLTPQALACVMALHQDKRRDEAARAAGLSEPGLDVLLQQLLDAGLLAHKPAPQPAFFVADAQDVALVMAHAAHVGAELADVCEQNWPSLSSLQPAFGDQAPNAYFLVGDRVLDVGLLDALARDGSLMPRAPTRPAADFPTARYFLWLVEGPYEALGHHGQRSTHLKGQNAYLLTFGQYEVDGKPNAAREAVEKEATVLCRDDAMTDEQVAHRLGVPFFDAAVSQAWTTAVMPVCNQLAAVYLQHASALRKLHSITRSGRRGPESFGDFMCWYDHLAYAHAIELLAASGRFHIPPGKFTAAVWHETPAQQAF